MTTKSAVPTPSSAMSPASLLFATSRVKQLTDFSKPHKNEALFRLRNSSLSLVILVLLTYLLPIPSLWKALNIVRGASAIDAFWVVCAAELVLSTLLGLNFIQAAVAIRYPRSPIPPLPSSPAKGLLTPQGQKKRRIILSPGQTSPQTQRSFSSSYVPSPVSTPSRTLYYSMPSTPSPFGVSLGASTNSVPSTPSPSLAAYHGKHPPSLGRAFNSSTLSLLAGESDDDS